MAMSLLYSFYYISFLLFILFLFFLFLYLFFLFHFFLSFPYCLRFLEEFTKGLLLTENGLTRIIIYMLLII